MNLLKKLFGFSLKKSSKQMFEQFIIDLETKKVQLEIHHNKRVLLIIDSLKNVPIWIERGNIDIKEFKNGFVVFFWLPKKSINKNLLYKNYKSTSSLNLKECQDKNVIFFMHFFNQKTTPEELRIYCLKLIDNIYELPFETTKIDVILRYLK